MSAEAAPVHASGSSRYTALLIATWLVVSGLCEGVLDGGGGIGISVGSLMDVDVGHGQARTLALVRALVSVGLGLALMVRQQALGFIVLGATVQLVSMALATCVNMAAPMLAVGVGAGLVGSNIHLAAALLILVTLSELCIAGSVRVRPLKAAAQVLTVMLATLTVACAEGVSGREPDSELKSRVPRVHAELANSSVVELAFAESPTRGSYRIVDPRVLSGEQLGLYGAVVTGAAGDVRGLAFGTQSSFEIRAPSTGEWPWEDLRWDGPLGCGSVESAGIRPGSSVEVLCVWGDFQIGRRATVTSVRDGDCVAWFDTSALNSTPERTSFPGCAVAIAPVLGQTVGIAGDASALVESGVIVGTVVSGGEGTVRFRLTTPERLLTMRVQVDHGDGDLARMKVMMPRRAEAAGRGLEIALFKLLSQCDADCAVSAQGTLAIEDTEYPLGTFRHVGRTTLSRGLTRAAGSAIAMAGWQADADLALEVELR